jgi:hypothetical protein
LVVFSSKHYYRKRCHVLLLCNAVLQVLQSAAKSTALSFSDNAPSWDVLASMVQVTDKLLAMATAARSRRQLTTIASGSASGSAGPEVLRCNSCSM